MNADGVLEVEGLTAGYDGRDVLHQVDLTLLRGEVLGIVGPNGSGKSTLIRALTKVLTPRQGLVRLQQRDTAEMTANELARSLAVVPQVALLPEGFSVLEITLMGRTPYLSLLQTEGPADLRIARRSMLQTSTLPLSERMVGDLSGGERQRVIVARALAQETPILLLDEPTVHLDIGHQTGLLDLVRTLVREQGLSVVAVIHDLSLAAQYCDRLILLDEGRVVATGTSNDVLQPELLRQVYDVEVRLIDHPVTGRPVVITVPGTTGKH